MSPSRPASSRPGELRLPPRSSPVFAPTPIVALLVTPLLLGGGGAGSAWAGSIAQDDAMDLSELSIEELLEMEVEVVYGASRRLQVVREAPSSVTIVTAKDIRAFGWRTLGDILESTAGMYISDDRNYSRLGVRGFSPPGDYSDRVLVLIDGHRVNEQVFDAAPMSRELPLDVDLIERLEVIRGPGSSLYGSNAFLAVINIVTRDAADVDGLEVRGRTGSHAMHEGRVTFGHVFGEGADLLLSATVFDTEGPNLFYPEYADTPSEGRTSGTDYEDGTSWFAELGYAPFTLRAAFATRTKGVPTGSYGTVFDDDRNRTVDSQLNLDLAYERPLGEQWGLKGRLFYDDYEYRGSYVYDYDEVGLPPYIVNKDQGDGRSWGMEAMVGGKPRAGHFLTVGAELRDLLRVDQANYDEDVYLDDRRDTTIWGLFAQDEIDVTEDIVVNIGVRQDHYGTFGGTTNPRIGVMYSPVETTTLKFVYGRAFRAPNGYELYYQDGGDTAKPNPGLDPETISTYEAMIAQQLGHGLGIDLSVFKYVIRDLITQVEDPDDGLLVFENSDEVEALGAELSLEGRWDSGWRLHASYGAQLARSADTETHLVNSPRHMTKFGVVVPLADERLQMAIEGRYLGERLTLGGDVARGFFTTDVNFVGRGLVKGLEFSLGVRNLFEVEGDDVAGFEHEQDLLPRDARTWFVGLTFAR